jgi:hypothetical protein
MPHKRHTSPIGWDKYFCGILLLRGTMKFTSLIPIESRSAVLWSDEVRPVSRTSGQCQVNFTPLRPDSHGTGSKAEQPGPGNGRRKQQIHPRRGFYILSPPLTIKEQRRIS